jgi:hypothetical protein
LQWCKTLYICWNAHHIYVSCTLLEVNEECTCSPRPRKGEEDYGYASLRFISYLHSCILVWGRPLSIFSSFCLHLHLSLPTQKRSYSGIF